MSTASVPAAKTNENTKALLSHLVSFGQFIKSVDEAALRDLEPIHSAIDGHKESHEMPAPADGVYGPAQGMRGGQAETQVNAHSDLYPQDGLTKQYEEYNRRLSAMEKALGSVSRVTSQMFEALKSVAAKAETESEKMQETEHKTKESEDMQKEDAASKSLLIANAIRKARIAVRKAEDEDEDEYKDEMCEKAQAALKALNDIISKAEDEAECEEDEKMTEKARADMKALKAKMKAKIETAKTVPVQAAPVAITKTEPSANDFTAELTALAASKGVTVGEMMAAFSGGPALRTPPMFSKAVAGTSMDAIARRLEDAIDSGVLDNAAIMKAESIKARLASARAGKIDQDMVMLEIAQADPAIRDVFAPSIAA